MGTLDSLGHIAAKPKRPTLVRKLFRSHQQHPSRLEMDSFCNLLAVGADLSMEIQENRQFVEQLLDPQNKNYLAKAEQIFYEAIRAHVIYNLLGSESQLEALIVEKLCVQQDPPPLLLHFALTSLERLLKTRNLQHPQRVLAALQNVIGFHDLTPADEDLARKLFDQVANKP